MRKIVAKREKFKWLTALCLCLLCFSLCLSMLVKPAFAAAPGLLDDLERLGGLRWDDTNRGPKKDSFGDMQPDSCAVGAAFAGTGVLGWARYRQGDKMPGWKLASIAGRLACADTSTADAAMCLLIYGDDELLYFSEIIRRSTRPIQFQVDLRGVTTIKMELMQVDAPSLPAGQVSSAYALLSEVALGFEPAPGFQTSLYKLTPLESSWAMAPFVNRDSLGGEQFGTKIGGTLDATGAMGVMGAARYQLDKKYKDFYAALACAEAGAADAVMQVKLYADGSATPLYTSPLIKRSTQPFNIAVSVSGVSVLKIELVGTTDPKAAQSPLSGWALLIDPRLMLAPPGPLETTTTTTTAAPTTTTTPVPAPPVYQPVVGWTGLYWLTSSYNPSINGHVYSFTRNPATDTRLLRVYAKDLYPQVRTVEDILIGAYYGLFGGAQLVSITPKGISYPEVMQSITLGGYTFSVPYGKVMVYAQGRFYSVAEAFRQGVLANEAIAAIAGLFNSAAPPALPALTPEQALRIKEDFLRSLEPEYYVNALANNVYLRLRRDGTVDFNAAGAAIWAGPDGAIGTLDDRVLTLREGSFFYEESPGVWRFVVSRYHYEDPRWAAWDTPTTTTAAPTTTTGPTGSIAGSTSTTTSPFLTTGGPDAPPKTGVPLNAGLFACVAALFMGCLYCGYRVAKKEKA